MNNGMVNPDQFNNEYWCRRITTEHCMVTPDSNVFGAAICPHEDCQHNNPLVGAPASFIETVFRCMRCQRVVVIDAAALDHWIVEGSADE